MTDSTEDARRTVIDLDCKLADALTRATDLHEERRRLAFDANTGEDAARKRLDKLNAASAVSGFEIENIKSAIDEGKRRLAEAERAAAMAALHANAREALNLAEAAGERGPRIARLTRELCGEIQATFADAKRFTVLGAPVVNQRSLKLALTRTILAQLRDADLDIQIIAPGVRHDPGGLVNGYVAQSTRWATAVLGERAAA